METPIAETIANHFVTLKPLAVDEADSYLEIGHDPEIWRYLAPEPFTNRGDAVNWIKGMLKRSDRSGEVPYSIYDNASGKLAGSSSYLDVRVDHGGLEIGFTWYGKDFQRTYVNTATKLALLENAFDKLGANRVQLQTDSRNQASRSAIERLGAESEGILRSHKIYPDGYIRDSAMYSIIVSEWPVIKERLEKLLRR